MSTGDAQAKVSSPRPWKRPPRGWDTLADGTLPDGNGADHAMEAAGKVLKKRIQEGIVDAGLMGTGHLKAQVTSVPIKDKKDKIG